MLGSGCGNSKKTAKLDAARSALKVLIPAIDFDAEGIAVNQRNELVTSSLKACSSFVSKERSKDRKLLRRLNGCGYFGILNTGYRCWDVRY